MVTTIKIHEVTKHSLDQKKKGKESYDEIIQRLVNIAEKQAQTDLLKQGYQSMHAQYMEEFSLWDQVE